MTVLKGNYFRYCGPIHLANKAFHNRKYEHSTTALVILLAFWLLTGPSNSNDIPMANLPYAESSYSMQLIQTPKKDKVITTMVIRPLDDLT